MLESKDLARLAHRTEKVEIPGIQFYRWLVQLIIIILVVSPSLDSMHRGARVESSLRRCRTPTQAVRGSACDSRRGTRRTCVCSTGMVMISTKKKTHPVGTKLEFDSDQNNCQIQNCLLTI